LVYFFQEERTQQKASEAKEVLLYGQFPPIDKMDASISTLVLCEYEKISFYFSFLISIYSFRKLSLSTNMIEKIANLNGLSKIYSFKFLLKKTTFV
jgi:dynein light chain 1